MKFSIIYEAQITEASREAEHQVYDEMVEQAVYAEKVGFDCIWAVEHTALTLYAHMSAPETFLAFLAGKTSTIHLGHGVVCLPPAMNHPIKVAERIATLDILSKGRLHFGVGKGSTQQEAGAYGYDLDDLQPIVDESMYLIPKLMVEKEVEHKGKYLQIPPRPINPKPYQDPHPPMYMACSRESTLEMAGARGLGALVMGFGGPEDIAKKNEIYRHHFSKRKPEDQVGYFGNEHLAALCPTIVMDDRAEARRIGLRGQRFFAEAINQWYRGGPPPSVDDISADEQRGIMDATREKIVTYLNEERIEAGTEATSMFEEVNDAYGTTDDCIRHVQRLFDAGADEIMFLMQMGTVPHEAIMESIRHIGETVIPHFKSKAAAARA